MNEVNRAADALYPSTGTRRTGNVKFFRGLSRDVTAEQLANQLQRASSQIVTGEAIRVTNVDADVAA